MAQRQARQSLQQRATTIPVYEEVPDLQAAYLSTQAAVGGTVKSISLACMQATATPEHGSAALWLAPLPQTVVKPHCCSRIYSECWWLQKERLCVLPREQWQCLERSVVHCKHSFHEGSGKLLLTIYRET
jgi:hypothetical protein